MKLKTLALGYCPPPTFKGCDVPGFLNNLKQFKTRFQLLLFSDHPYEGMVLIKGSPEQAKDLKPRTRLEDPPAKINEWAVNNLIFFTGLRIALAHNVTHFIYLEADCRVQGDNWDEKIFAEHFNTGTALCCSGSLVTYNPCNGGREGWRRWNELVVSNTRRNHPIPAYGFKGAADSTGSSVFPNGAGGVYDVEWLRRLFDVSQSHELAVESFAWDFALGRRLWEAMGARAYDSVAHLQGVFSSFGNVLTTQQERLAMLQDGKTVLVHQVKGIS